MDTRRLGVSHTGGSDRRLGDRLRVALVVSGFPTRDDPRRGVFNMRALAALAPFADVTVLFLRAWAPGRYRRQFQEFAGTRTITITAPQLPVRGVFGKPPGIAANILLYRGLGWHVGREAFTGADIIHSVDGVVGMVVSGWASRAGKRHVTQVIGSDVNTIIPRLPSFVARGWNEWLHGVICNSRDLARRFSALYPGVPNVRAVLRGVDLQTFSPVGPVLGPQAHERPVRFAFFGGFTRQALDPTYVKGGPTLLSAWKEAEHELATTGASLLLAGPACRSELVSSWRRGLRYPARIHVIGEASPAEMPGYLRAVDALLVPSFAEGLPNVCMEASACGRSVLASAVGGVPDVVVHGETGLLLAAGDVRAWASALVDLSTQGDLLREMGQRGRARMQRLFDARNYGKGLVAVYEDALNRPLAGAVPS
jgi:glycosyltransferase involved in cell wall biosynthesis